MWALTKSFALVAALGAVAQARPHRRQASVFTSCTKDNTAAITFDDGPYTWTRQVVDTLDAAGAKGTFFVNGNNFGCIFSGSNPSNLKYAYDQGHQIASHTWSHPHLRTLSESQTRTELTRTNDAIQQITGAVPAFIRPPYGEYSETTQAVAGELGQTIVIWDFDSGDAAGASAESSLASLETFISGNPVSVLTLNHETHSSTVDTVLPRMIEALQGKGYSLVTVAECMGMDPYLSTGGPTSSGGSC